VETHAGEGRYFSNVVTEIEGGEGSTIDHTKVVAESGDAYHIGAVEVRQGRSSTVRTSLLGLDGLLVRNDVSTTMAGEGASCVLDGLYVLGGRQHFDANTRIVHDSPHTDSVELYKGVLDQAARGVFNGVIVVRPDAQKITAHQTSKNLLLSNEAIADSNPQLEIHADDVKCAHGSTIGQLDETSLFYLRSRGIGLDEARGILTLAFAGEVVDRIRIESLRDRLRASLLDRLAPAVPKELS
jgi:Fe-S cluster assembly protein SufD